MNVTRAPAVAREQIRAIVEEELLKLPFIDVHTHLFMPSLGKLGLWGIDELITSRRSCSASRA